MVFSQKQSEDISLDNLSIEEFLNLAIETSNLLGWVFSETNDAGFAAYTNNGLFSWNAQVKLHIADGSANLESQSRGDDITDLRGNKKNLQSFISTFNGLKKTFRLSKMHPSATKRLIA